jgi:predicted RNase H-like nuclease (RuvC/YqgF family)
MTFRELESWRTKHNVPDTWWVSVDGAVQETTFALAEALQIKSQSPDMHVAVLNNIYANSPNPSWVDLTIQAVNISGTRPPIQEAAKVEKAATAAAPATATASAAIPADFLEKFNALHAEVESLKREVASLRKIADTYKDSFAEAKAILDEREAFLEMSESQLFEKAQQQEVRNTEMEQLKENLDKREATLKAQGA